MSHLAHWRGVSRVLLVLCLLGSSVLHARDGEEIPPTEEPPAVSEGAPAEPASGGEAASGWFGRRRLFFCAAALVVAGAAVGAYLWSPTVFHEAPMKLQSDGKEMKVNDPRRAAEELRSLLDGRGGSMRIDVRDPAGDPPVLRLFDKTRMQRIAADRIKAAIQKRNPNVADREIGVGEAGMVIKVRYFELILQPDGMIRLAVGGLTWRLESSRSYDPAELLDGAAHQMDFGPHVELDPSATATFRAGFLLRFDPMSRRFVVPHAKCTMRVDARPFLNDEDSGEARDVSTAEVR